MESNGLRTSGKKTECLPPDTDEDREVRLGEERRPKMKAFNYMGEQPLTRKDDVHQTVETGQA